jgi:hypothetical protein
LGQSVHRRGMEAGSLLTTKSMGATAAMIFRQSVSIKLCQRRYQLPGLVWR